MSVDLYRDKYIKYKGKYLNLKNAEGGGEIGEAWYFLLPEHIDELAKIYNANTILEMGDIAPSSDRIEKLLKKMGKDAMGKDAYMIKLGDKLLKNVVKPGTNQKSVPGDYRLGHILNDEAKSKADEASKKGKGFFGRIGQSFKNTASTLADKMIPYSSMREKGDMSLVSNDQITIHINALKAELPNYKVVHIDFSTNTNKYLPHEIELKNTTGENPVVERSKKLLCTFKD